MVNMEHLVKDHLEGFQGNCYFPGTETFDKAVADATSENYVMAGRIPALYLQPVCANDVSLAVKMVSQAASLGLVSRSVPLTICGGGHSELGVMNNSIVLHMSKLTEIDCSPDRHQVTFGSGVTLGPLSRAVAKYGMAVPIGTWETVGCGLVLQGGIGHLTRYASVTADNILEVEAVLSDGRVKMLNNKSEGIDKDIFWGIRGAGPALAVVTKITLRTYPITSVKHTRVIRKCGTNDEDATFLRKCELTLRKLPKDQNCDIIIGSGNNNELTCGLFPMTFFDKKFDRFVTDALGFANDSLIECSYCDYPGASLTTEDFESIEAGGGAAFSAQTAAGVLTYMRNMFVDELSTEGWRVIVAAIKNRPTLMCSIALQHTGGTVRSTEAGVFRCRNFEFSVVIGALWTDNTPNMRDLCMKWADDVWQKLLPFGTGTYAADVDNFRRSDRIDHELRLAFGENLERLRLLKQVVDPGSMLKGTYALNAS